MFDSKLIISVSIAIVIGGIIAKLVNDKVLAPKSDWESDGTY